MKLMHLDFSKAFDIVLFQKNIIFAFGYFVYIFMECSNKD